jgi:hypothetical protein
MEGDLGDWGKGYGVKLTRYGQQSLPEFFIDYSNFSTL